MARRRAADVSPELVSALMGSTPAAVQCARCGAAFPVPELSGAQRAQIAAACRGSARLEAIRRLRALSGLSLHDAKGVMLHVTARRGVCHHCQRALAAGASECGACHALCLDW